MSESVDTLRTTVSCPHCGASIHVLIDTVFNAQTMEGRYLPRYRHECPEVTRIEDEVDAAVLSAVDAEMTR